MAKTGNGYTSILDPVQEAQGVGATEYRPLFADVAEIKLADMATLQARKERNVQDAWIGKMGLDAEDTAAQGINLGASLLSGASRTVGNVATLPIDLIAGMAQGTVPEAQIQAYNRSLTGEVQPGDDALLDQTAPLDDGIPQTYRERLQGSTGLQQVGKKVADFFDISGIVDTTRRDRLSDDLRNETADSVQQIRDAKESFDKGEYTDAAKDGAAGLFRTIGSAISTGAQDPGAVTEYVVENVPQIVAAMYNPAALTATNAGYGFDAYREGITEYADKNEGQLPNESERAEMGLFAASAAAAEMVGDVSLIKGFKNSGKGIGAGAASVAGAGTREGVTEGYQTYAEARAKLEEPTIEEIVEGATIGALVGGNFQLAAAGGSRAAGTANSAAEKIEANQNVEDLFQQSVASGDISDLARVDPTRAVQALGELSKDADQATVDANTAKADQIYKDLNSDLSNVQARMEMYSEEGVADLRETAQWLEDNNGTASDKKAVADAIKAAEAYTPAKRKADEATAFQLQNQLDSVQEASQRLFTDSTPDVDSLVEQANTGDVQAADRVLTLTMTNPDAITTEMAQAMAGNESLSTEQRQAMASFSEAQEATDAFKGRAGVRSDVINGGSGFKGLEQYRNAIRMAITDGNTEAAQAQVDSLNSFATSRVSKATALAQAYEQVKGTNNQISIAPDSTGNWVQTDMGPADTRKAGGLMVGPTSFRLAADVAAEADVLTKNANAFQAMVTAAPKLPEVQAAPVQETTDAETTTVPTDTAVSDDQRVDTAVPNAEQQTTEEPAPVVNETGELTAVKQSTGEAVTAENRQQVNLVGELFTQNAGSELDASNKPLVSVPNFASKLRAGEVRVQDFLAQKGEIAGPQRAAINNFFGFARLVDKHVVAGFTRRRSPEFRFQDYAQYLINEDGSVDENARTAISYGMFSWLSENAGNLYNTDAGINMILNRDIDDEVSPDAYRTLGRIGTREDVVANQLGARIAQALGLRAKPEASASDTARLETALGIQAIGAMARAGLIKRTEISDATMQRLMNTQDPAVSNAVHTFVTVASEKVNDRDVANEVVRKIREATTGSQSVVNKLFSVEAAGKEPSYEPVKFDQAYAKRTNREIPSTLAKILDKEGSKKHFVRQDMNQIAGVLSSDALYKIAGVIDTTDNPTHAYNLASRDAKNAGLIDQVDNFKSFVEKMTNDPTTEGIEQPLYFGRSVWMPQRVGLNTNVINPQTSKVHRHMLAMEGWESSVDINDPVQFNNFKLRVLEAFGVKTEAKSTALVLPAYDAKVNTPGIQAAVNELATILRGEATNPNEDVIVAGVAEAGENMHSLDALVSLAHMQNAQDGKFNTTLMAEVDGLTNGPMLSLMMLGAKGFDVMTQGGFIPQGALDANGNELIQFNDYKGMGNHDLYESTVSDALKRLDGTDPALLNALQVVTGQLLTEEGAVSSKGRNVIKKPLTAMMFGSNTLTAVQGMADGFIESIYSKMEDAAKAKDPEAMRTLLNAVNTLTRFKGLHLDANMGIDVAMQTNLTQGQVDAIKATFHEMLGSKVEDSLKDNYGLFIARRDTVNKTAQLAFRLYDAAYTALTEQAEETSTSIARRTGKTGKQTALSSLSTAEVKAINDRLTDMQPILQTAMSKQSDQLAAGMNMSKSKRELDRTDPFTSQAYFGDAVPTYQEDGSVVNRATTSVNGLRTKATDPGVAPFITSIHSTDSSIASSVYGEMNALNVHDALGVNLHQAQEVGQKLNKATFDNMLNYSAPAEMVSTLERVLAGLDNLMQDPELAARIQPKLKTLANEMAQKKLGTFEEQLTAIRDTARAADTEKLNMLASMQAVGQYATEGGSYIVTDADRTAALKQLDSIGENFDSAAEQSAANIDQLTKAQPLDLKAAAAKALSRNSVETLSPATTLNTLDRLEQTPEVQAVREAMLTNNVTLEAAKAVLPEHQAAELVNQVNDNTRKLSVWGEVGTPLVQSNVDLVNVLATNKLTAAELVDSLAALNADPFTGKLLEMIKRTVKPSMPVNYITPDTAPDGALGTGVSKARGWYHQEAGAAAIYVKSPDFVESGITPEMLTHELVHAALAGLVDENTGKNNPVGQAVADLEALRLKAAELMEANGSLSGKYQNAVGNVHELLAWGLTNQGFQQEVLANIQIQSRAKGLWSGMRAFVDSLARMLFRGSNTKANETGLGMLVAQSAGLFKAAADLRKTRDAKTLAYEDAVDHINAMTAQEVVTALEGASPRIASEAHQAHLKDVMTNLVEPLYGPYGAFKEEAAANRAITPMDVYLKSLDTGTKPFASRALASPFNVNQQEGFVLESVQASLEAAMTNPNTVFVRQALTNLFNDGRKALKPENFHKGDWATATPTEKDIAQQKHEFLFKNSNVTQFAAMGIASEEVKNILTFRTSDATVPLASLPIAGRLVELFRRVMTKLASLHTKVSPNTRADFALATLLDQLVDIEAKHKDEMLRNKLSGMDQVEMAIGSVADNVRERAEAFGKIPFFKQNSSAYVRVAGAGISALAGDRVGAILDHTTVLRDRAFKDKHGVIMGAITEMRGLHDGNRIADALFKGAKAIEKDRKDHIENTVAQVMASFKDGGEYLNKETKDSITRVFLRTNMSALADAVGIDRLKELMESPAEMTKHRKDLEAQVQAMSPDFGYLTAATKDLAYHKVVGGNVSHNLMLNTRNIAEMYGTKKAGTQTNVKQLVPLLDQLLAVYAHSYTGTYDKALAMQAFRTEANRGNGQNGIDMILKLHSGLQKKSTTDLFKGQEALQQSGYVPEIHDNNIEVMLVARADLDKFEKAGYRLATELQKDSTDQTKDDRVMVTRRGSGQSGLLTGALSYTGYHRKGSSPDRASVNLLNGNQVTSAQHKSMIRKAKQPLIDALLNRDLSYDPRNQEAGKMVPVLAPDGRIADYRYMMTENNRDTLLDRENAMEQVLGTFAGQIVDKVASAQQNADVVGAMYDQYRADYNNRPSSYLQVGKDSKDPEIAELYRLLPESTKRDIKRIWKSDNMMIPADQLNMIMGYRKYSLTEAFAKPERDLKSRAGDGDRNWAEQLFVMVTRSLLGDKAALRVGQAEDVMQELVKEMKDILVVKNVTTLVGNIVSNLSLLGIEGVSPKEMINSHAVALKGALDYRKDRKREMQIEQAIEIGYIPEGQPALEAELAQIKDRLARNPIKPLVDAGLMPTIVEDVEADDSQYSYKSRLQRGVSKYTSRVPKLLKEAGKQVYMTHDTSTYKFLSQTTQLSDLIARYAMYQHTMNRARNPLSQADALRQAEESFVNYDLPSHRSIQYLNDMGIVMFTKYYMRIQKTIMRLVKEKPARVLGAIAIDAYTNGMSSVINSSWTNRLGRNPLQDGAFGYFGTLDELPVFKFL
ncbi:virion RNA polymerase [Pseudomonas phage Littlefix]|uniref:RNA polymerase n=1 Tax=Pseudomonas phage Littlefix TaxID=2079289 RepID=A0A2K9VHI4_9CAUD|nr:virion RNA polymerase [Pseudomonas phage Littlefix]AUV61826.1 RNA polymerase [Pseudomonas phage Littlefix]